MPTHRIKADLDVDGEVQGTSLDINGVADITSAAGSADMITLHNTTNGSGCSIKFTDQNRCWIHLRGYHLQLYTQFV